MKKAFLSVGKKQPRSLRSIGLFWEDLRVLVPPLDHCVPRREFHVTSHGVDDFMRFNLMPCLPTYSRLIKSYATFTGWSCDLFTCLLTKKYGSKKKIRASRENNLATSIGGGKTMGGEPKRPVVSGRRRPGVRHKHIRALLCRKQAIRSRFLSDLAPMAKK